MREKIERGRGNKGEQIDEKHTTLREERERGVLERRNQRDACVREGKCMVEREDRDKSSSKRSTHERASERVERRGERERDRTKGWTETARVIEGE